jgi:hypothetical protein
MPLNVMATLRFVEPFAGSKQRAHLDRQIAGVRSALDGLGTGAGVGRSLRSRARVRRRRRMSAAARRAVSQRMKAYWAKRRATRAKGGEAK